MVAHAHESHIAARVALLQANTEARAALDRVVASTTRATTAGGTAMREPTTAELEHAATRIRHAAQALAMA